MKDNFKYMLSNWLKWDKKSLKFFFLWVPALVLQPLVTAYIPKAMIDAIDNGVTVGDMTVIVALLSLLLTLTIWLDPFMKELVRGGARIVRMRYAVAAFRKTLTTDYVNIESYEGREKQSGPKHFIMRAFPPVRILWSSALIFSFALSALLPPPFSFTKSITL